VAVSSIAPIDDDPGVRAIGLTVLQPVYDLLVAQRGQTLGRHRIAEAGTRKCGWNQIISG
jgi:hypothetical protein